MPPSARTSAVSDTPNIYIVHLSDYSKLFLFILILISHVTFALYWIYYFIRETRSTIRKKAPTLYLTMFLCCRKQQFLVEKESEEYRDRMAPYLASIERLVECKCSALLYGACVDMNSKRADYLGGRIPMEDEGLKRILMVADKFIANVDKAVAFQSKKDKGQDF
jgi:hypothetical protein